MVLLLNVYSNRILKQEKIYGKVVDYYHMKLESKAISKRTYNTPKLYYQGFQIVLSNLGPARNKKR